MNNNKSRKLFNSAKEIIPGGVNSPVRSFNSVGGVPPFISRAKGVYIWDVDNNKYIDYVSSWGPMILGHAHPEVIKSIVSTAFNGTSYGAPIEKELILAEMIINRVSGCDMVRLTSSGTEATMSAIRLARGVTGREKIIKFNGCYHGHNDSFLIQAGSGPLTFGKPDSPGVTISTAKDTLVAEFNNIQSVRDLIDNYQNKIAAIIIEPVNGNVGCIPPKNDFLSNLRELCTKNDIVLIFDEVMTGFRIAKGGASERYKVKPDLFTFGKIIGGGLPIGAFGGEKGLMQEVSPIGNIYHAGTLSGNPLSVVAGIETLKRLTEESYVKLEHLGSFFENKLKNIIDENKYPIFQSRVGSMFSIFFNSGIVNNVNDVLNCDFVEFKAFFHYMLNNGIYLAPSQYEVGFLSLAHTEEILDKTIMNIEEALQNIYA